MRRILQGALLGLAIAGAPVSADPNEAPVPYEECAFDWIPWAETIEGARERAKEGRRLVLAFAFPWDGKAYESGYAAASRVRESAPSAGGDAERRRDPGYAKEQAVLTVLLGDPDLSGLVARAFVPVRLRLHTWHFFEGGPGPLQDPLPALGTSDRETRPPALIVSTPDGALVKRVERMGVFNPHVVHRTLLEALRKTPRFRPEPIRASEDFRAGVQDAAACGDHEEARRRCSRPPPGEEAWAAVTAARLSAIEGDLAAAESALREVRDVPERRALLAEIALRRGEDAAVAAMDGLEDDDRGRAALAYALGRTAQHDRARDLWRRLLASDPKGGLGARARMHLAGDGPRALEWETLDERGADPTASTTLGRGGGEAGGVRYLLSQQDPDGSWKAPRGASGPADLSVPRTALCVSALRAWQDAVKDPQRKAAEARGVAYVDRWADAPTQDVWSLTYALHLELELLRGKDGSEHRRRATALLAGLSAIEHDGGWTYFSPARLHTFNTAPVLVLLVRSRDLGLEVDPAQIARAAAFLERNRVASSGVFHYGTTMEHMSGEKGKTDERSTCMRSAVCELALHAAGKEKGTRRIEGALDLFFENQAAARATQKIFESYVDVTSLQDSYRYFFGAWYAAQAIRALPDGKRKKPAARLTEIVRSAQEYDGSFVDSQMIGKSSSTALALLALAEARDAAPAR